MLPIGNAVAEGGRRVNEADWDERHGDPTRRWSGGPSRYLVDEAAGLPAGRALDLACGQGRHAVWLAENGWQVTAVDFSGVAIDKARAHAAEKGVAVDWVHADLMEYEAESEAFDLVMVFYLHLPVADRRRVLRTMRAALAPGGTLLVVGHDRSNLESGYGGPSSPAVLYSGVDVVADLGGLEIERMDRVDRPVRTDDGERVAIDLVVRARRAA
jgi:SAM-dependent methyltransferase